MYAGIKHDQTNSVINVCLKWRFTMLYTAHWLPIRRNMDTADILFFPPYSWLCHWCRRNSMVDFGINPILRGTRHLEKHPSCVMPDRAIDRTCLWPVKSVCLNNSYAQLCLGEASDSWGVISFKDLGSDWTSNERFIWWSDTEKKQLQTVHYHPNKKNQYLNHSKCMKHAFAIHGW